MRTSLNVTITSLFLLGVCVLSVGAQPTPQLVTNGVVYQGDSSALIPRANDVSARVPINVVTPTQGWVAMRVRMGFSATTSVSPDPIMWDMSESDPSDLFLYYDAGSDTFHLVRRRNQSGATVSSPSQTFAQGDTKTLIAAWTGSQIMLSIDGGPFVTAATNQIPNQASLYIGSTAVQGQLRQINSSVYWTAIGVGTLDATHAAHIHSFGNADQPRAAFPGNATFVWHANSNVIETDGGGPLDISLCAPNSGSFSSTISNPYYPLPVGAKWTLEGGNPLVHVEVTSLSDTLTVAGVTTRVIEEREWEAGALLEVARNYFAQKSDGTVCYFGEDVDMYQNGQVVSHDGAWKAGVGGAQPGIFMPANPQLGQTFPQEAAPGIAEDTATIIAMGESVTTPAGSYTDTLRIRETNPLDGGVSIKVFARNAGMVVDDEMLRIASSGGGGGSAPQVTLTKSVSPLSASPGAILAYTITVQNAAGAGNAQNLVLSDVLPQGVTFVSASHSGTLSGSTVIWPATTLAAGASLPPRTLTVTVNGGGGGGQQPVINSFIATPSSVAQGGSSTLSWSSSNATSCTASGGWSGSKPTSGTQSVSPSQTTTYILSCSNASGTDTKTVSVAVQSGGPATTHEQRVAISRAEFASDSRINCSKYPEKRIFVETQAWWMQTASARFPSSIPSVEVPEAPGKGGHAHTATCFPSEEKVNGSGTMQFDVRLMLHKGNEAAVEWLDIGLGPGGSSLARVNLNPKLTCPGGSDPAVNCMYWVPISLDVSKVPSGYQELRFRFNMHHPSGDRQFATTGWNAWYHGGTSTYRTPPWQEARGWWADTGYTRARLLSTIPMNPVSGNLSLKIQGSNASRTGLHIDAFFNMNDFGEVIFETKSSDHTGVHTIDTTKLSNGMHWVAILASKEKGAGTNTGIFQFPIIVNN